MNYRIRRDESRKNTKEEKEKREENFFLSLIIAHIENIFTGNGNAE